MAREDIDGFRQRTNQSILPTDENLADRMRFAALLIRTELANAERLHTHLVDEHRILQELDCLERWLGLTP